VNSGGGGGRDCERQRNRARILIFLSGIANGDLLITDLALHRKNNKADEKKFDQYLKKKQLSPIHTYRK